MASRLYDRVDMVPSLQELQDADAHADRMELEAAERTAALESERDERYAAGEQEMETDHRPDPAALGPETAGEKLRNALMILNCAGEKTPAADAGWEVGSPESFRHQDIVAARRLLATAIEQVKLDEVDRRAATTLLGRADLQVVQLRRNLELAMAKVRRLELAAKAPSPIGIVLDQRSDSLVVALSDGTMMCYTPSAPSGKRWSDLEPVPTSRAALLAGEGAE